MTKSLFFRYLIPALLYALVGACSGDDPAPDESSLTGAVRPFGEVIGNVLSGEIGPAGGVLRSASGDIEVTFPPDALKETVAFALQPVTNTAPNGTGNSYRITPHDVVLAKPVTITMIYSDSISFVDGLGIAFQAEDGIWYWPGTLKHDRDAREIRVETTNFSDWSIFESIKISPSRAVVEPGGEIQLQALGTFPEDVEDDLLTPLVPQEPIPLNEPAPLDPSYIEEWTLRGEGAISGTGNTITYKAPANVPENDEAIVSAKLRLKSGSPFHLVSTITIGGSEILLDGGPYSNFRAVAKKLGAASFNAQSGVTAIVLETAFDEITKVGVTILYPSNAPGVHQWQKPVCAVMTAETSVGSTRIIAGSYESDEGVHPGVVEVTKYGAVGGIITGRFEGQLTFIDTSCEGCKRTGFVRGTFTAMRFK